MSGLHGNVRLEFIISLPARWRSGFGSFDGSSNRTDNGDNARAFTVRGGPSGPSEVAFGALIGTSARNLFQIQIYEKTYGRYEFIILRGIPPWRLIGSVTSTRKARARRPRLKKTGDNDVSNFAAQAPARARGRIARRRSSRPGAVPDSSSAPSHARRRTLSRTLNRRAFQDLSAPRRTGCAKRTARPRLRFPNIPDAARLQGAPPGQGHVRARGATATTKWPSGRAYWRTRQWAPHGLDVPPQLARSAMLEAVRTTRNRNLRRHPWQSHVPST